MAVRGFCALVAIALALALGGCGSGGKPPPPTKIKGEIAAAAALNPDPGGRPSPVVTRIYYLKSATAFESADFFSLYGNPTEVLGEDLIASEEFMMQPGQSRPYEAEFDAKARFVGVMAAFRNIEGAQWREVVALPEDSLLDFIKRKKLSIQLEDVSVGVGFE